ncbi:MAG: hypothetical protein AAGG08_09800 [Actinomycetota bacterium]
MGGDTVVMRQLRSVVVVAVVLVVMAGPAIFIALRAAQGSAEFADDETIGDNLITAARVDIGIGTRTVPLVGANLAPGDVRRGSIELTNDGTVGLRYALRGEEVGASNRELASWMTWRAQWAGPSAACPSTLGAEATVIDGAVLGAGGPLLGDAATGPDPGDRVLRPGERDLLCLEVSLDLAAPNSVQSGSIVQPIVAEAEQLIDTVGADS